jgi:hypothetical protein
MGILLLELRVVLSKRGDLARSPISEGKNEEGEDNVPSPLELAQGNPLPIVVFQGKVRCGMANIYH